MFASPSKPAKIAAQKRFLDASRETLHIASAARLAGVHRATVYRRLADPEFADAMRVATEEFFRRCRERVAA